MAITQNLEIVKMEARQDDKELVINDALDVLDGTIAGQLTHDMSSDANYTLLTASDEQYNFAIKITDGSSNLTTTRDIVFPDNNQMHIAWNSTGGGHSLNFKTTTGTGVLVADGEKKLVYSDGTNMQVVAGLQTTEYPVDINIYKQGVPANSEVLLIYPITRQTEFPASLVGSQGKSGVSATASTTISVQKNGAQFGTIVFAAVATVPTYTGTLTTFNPGDYLSIVAPASADATLADIGITLKISNLAV